MVFDWTKMYNFAFVLQNTPQQVKLKCLFCQHFILYFSNLITYEIIDLVLIFL